MNERLHSMGVEWAELAHRCRARLIPIGNKAHDAAAAAAHERLTGKLPDGPEWLHALQALAPHHSPTEHARAASRLVADIGGAH